MAAALKENVEFFLANGRIMTAFDANLSDRPFMHIPPSTIHNQVKIKKNKLLENAEAPTPPPCLNSGQNEIMQPPLEQGSA